MKFKKFKTWVEISSQNIFWNIKVIRSLLNKKTKLFAVVKSNAYGHDLELFSKLIETKVDGYCVDSVPEAEKLRAAGIKKFILVLGPTLPHLFEVALKLDITISLSNSDALKEYLKNKAQPNFHLKIDTGMHRQGFYNADLKKILTLIKPISKKLTGVFSHFASAKDFNYPTTTDLQYNNFQSAKKTITQNFPNQKIDFHIAASSGTMISSKYHEDAVRVGAALYGVWPSKEIKTQWSKEKLEPALAWYSIISEVKSIKKGDYVSYDLTEKIKTDGQIGIIPIGYWHGFDRKLSSIGEILVNGKRAKVLGRVTMDMIVIDLSQIKANYGDKATIIGKNQKEEIELEEMANKISTSPYEVVTRLNPLMHREII